MTLENFIIFIDTREQANRHITKWFDIKGIKHIDDYANDVGDYYAGGKVVVERKKDFAEWAGNCGKGHQRFKAELERAKSLGLSVKVVIEEVGDLQTWTNSKAKSQRVLADGTVKKLKPLDGKTIQLIMNAWAEKYDIEYIFTTKANSPALIATILWRDLQNEQ